jgi:hypothetical protein
MGGVTPLVVIYSYKHHHHHVIKSHDKLQNMHIDYFPLYAFGQRIKSCNTFIQPLIEAFVYLKIYPMMFNIQIKYQKNAEHKNVYEHIHISMYVHININPH